MNTKASVARFFGLISLLIAGCSTSPPTCSSEPYEMREDPDKIATIHAGESPDATILWTAHDRTLCMGNVLKGAVSDGAEAIWLRTDKDLEGNPMLRVAVQTLDQSGLGRTIGWVDCPSWSISTCFPAASPMPQTNAARPLLAAAPALFGSTK